MSLPLVAKIGAALGVGGLVYWAVARWGSEPAAAAPTTTKDSAPAAKPKPGAAPPAPAPAKDYSGISGTTHAADDVSGTILGKKSIEQNILDGDRKTVRPGYHVSATETWRDPGDNSLYAIWYRDSDGVRGVFYDGVFHRMG